MSSPLLETSVEGARSILLSITGGTDLSLWEVNEAARAVAEAAHPSANIIFGAMIDEKISDECWVTVVATGYGDRPTRRSTADAPARAGRRAARAAQRAGCLGGLRDARVRAERWSQVPGPRPGLCRPSYSAEPNYAAPDEGRGCCWVRADREAGAEALREGGNAFDAAVCAVLASFTAESLLTGLGAGGFMLAHTADGEDHLLDFFVEAGGRGLDPAARGELVAAEVRLRRDAADLQRRPGVVRCARDTAPGCGRSSRALRLDAVRGAGPARRCATRAKGVPVDRDAGLRVPPARALITRDARDLRAVRAGRTAAARGGAVPVPGPGRRARAARRRRARTGSTGARRRAAICEWVTERGGCLLEPRTSTAYRVIEREPVRTSYRGREVLTNAPPSSGGILIAYALDLLERTGTGDRWTSPTRSRCWPR